MFSVFSTGDVIAIAIAVLSSLITIAVTLFVQLREDRRALSAETWRREVERQRRVTGYFASILHSAELIQGMTNIFNWKRDDARTETERADLYETIRRIQLDLQNASVNLTLDGITEPVDLIDELFHQFTEFRLGLSQMGVPGAPHNVRTEMMENKKAIDSLRGRLVKELPVVLKSLEPAQPRFVRRRTRPLG